MEKETWDQIWLRKGNNNSTDLRELNGYEKTAVDLDQVGAAIADAIGIRSGQRVLDIGCGAGAMARSLQKIVPGIHYVGTDRSATLVKKHIAVLNNSVLNFSADEPVFNDRFFDVCICFGVFLYFDSLEYAKRVVNQLVRQGNAVYIGDIPMRSHSPDHLLYDGDAVNFILEDVDRAVWTWEISRGLYDPYKDDRFNIAMKRIS